MEFERSVQVYTQYKKTVGHNVVSLEMAEDVYPVEIYRSPTSYGTGMSDVIFAIDALPELIEALQYIYDNYIRLQQIEMELEIGLNKSTFSTTEEQNKVLDELVAEAQELGFYDKT